MNKQEWQKLNHELVKDMEKKPKTLRESPKDQWIKLDTKSLDDFDDYIENRTLEISNLYLEEAKKVARGQQRDAHKFLLRLSEDLATREADILFAHDESKEYHDPKADKNKALLNTDSELKRSIKRFSKHNTAYDKFKQNHKK